MLLMFSLDVFHLMQKLLAEIRNCTLCASHLTCGPNPIIQAGETAKILIVGQAPGRKVHESGIPWDDRSGDRLRSWLDLNKSTFYDSKQFAIVPMGFCFPGTDKHGGDNPPRKECAPKWHPALFDKLININLTLLVGSYAQRYYLKETAKESMHATVRAWREYLPRFFPLPHPSWRNTGWLRENPWFNEELLPELQAVVKKNLRL